MRKRGAAHCTRYHGVFAPHAGGISVTPVTPAAAANERIALGAGGGLAMKLARATSVAFPVIYQATGELLSSADYATLMRELCQRNGGSFIALAAR